MPSFSAKLKYSRRKAYLRPSNHSDSSGLLYKWAVVGQQAQLCLMVLPLVLGGWQHRRPGAPCGLAGARGQPGAVHDGSCTQHCGQPVWGQPVGNGSICQSPHICNSICSGVLVTIRFQLLLRKLNGCWNHSFVILCGLVQLSSGQLTALWDGGDNTRGEYEKAVPQFVFCEQQYWLYLNKQTTAFDGRCLLYFTWQLFFLVGILQ